MPRLILPLLATFLLTACASGGRWGEWFPEEKPDEETQFICDYWGNCSKERSDACDFYGNCKSSD